MSFSRGHTGHSLHPVTGTTREVVALLRGWLAEPGEPEPIQVETSGSTGRPKRVVLSRRAVLASVTATAERLGGQGTWLLALPASYVAGLQVVVRSLLGGHEPVLLEEHQSLAHAVEAAGGGHLFTSLVPTQLHRYLDSPADVAALRRVDTILLGGGPVDPSLRGRAAAEGLTVVATYGASETAGGCVYDGYPLAGVRVEAESDGRLRIQGPMLFDSYADDPALTAETLVDGWFRTSDVGHVDPDGRVRVLGRIDDVVISGGVNVPLPAVRRRLLEHPAVEAAEVLGVPDEEWGQRVVAFVVARGEGTIGREDARDWVAAELPRAWAPYELFLTEELPLLPNGKVDRIRLRGLFG